MRKHLIAAGFLATTAVSAARIVVSIKHQRQRAHLATAQMHQTLLADQTANPYLADTWWHLEPVSDSERTEVLHSNRWMSLWAVQHRTGVLPPQALRETVHDFLNHPRGRAFWERARIHRSRSARDKNDHRFVSLINEVYEALVDPVNDAEPAA